MIYQEPPQVNPSCLPKFLLLSKTIVVMDLNFLDEAPRNSYRVTAQSFASLSLLFLGWTHWRTLKNDKLGAL